MSTRCLLAVCLFAGLAAACSSAPVRSSLAAPPATGSPSFLAPSLAHALVVQDDDGNPESSEGHGLFGTLAWWIPNRLLDVFDIVRLRLRLGPGAAVGARVTEVADVYLGTYVSVYLGLPGPRGRQAPRWPVGFESKTGAEISAADVSVDGMIGPEYGTYEIGLGAQVLLVGVDFGIEPFEILDFVVGILTFDPADDDF